MDPRADLAVNGGAPVRERLLPYGRQSIDEDDVQAVVAALRSDWLTTGPRVAEFEAALCAFTGAGEGVAVSNGTAALHAAMYALGVGPGDEVIVPAMTFAASANCVAFCGGTPVFADVDPGTLLLDPASAEARITPRTRAIVAVDYAGQPCDYAALRGLAERHGLALVADACHSLGATVEAPQGTTGGTRAVGTLADLSVFSFHPVKHLTTGEGGMVLTSSPDLARRARLFRSHGITTDARQREQAGSWFYEMTDLGYNYRLTDLQCALGLSQLRKLPGWLERRRAIARAYDAAFGGLPEVLPLGKRAGVGHAYHLYVVLLDPARLSVGRGEVFAALRAEGLGVNVHYLPVHLHPFYRQRFGTSPGQCPVAEAAYQRMITLPLFPGMSDADVADVVRAVRKVVAAYRSEGGSA
jgi:perosamine synthetase